MKAIKFLLSALIIASCAQVTEKKESVETGDIRKDGIYPTQDGWDIIHKGKTYEFDCDPAGLTVLTDNITPEYYTICFEFKDEIYNSKLGWETKTKYNELSFAGEPKDGWYLFGSYWTDYMNDTEFIEYITFSIPDGNGTELKFRYEQHREVFHKMTKYMKSNGY